MPFEERNCTGEYDDGIALLEQVIDTKSHCWISQISASHEVVVEMVLEIIG
jgi:hypothetical protein